LNAQITASNRSKTHCSENSYSDYYGFLVYADDMLLFPLCSGHADGETENARHENVAPSKMQVVKISRIFSIPYARHL